MQKFGIVLFFAATVAVGLVAANPPHGHGAAHKAPEPVHAPAKAEHAAHAHKEVHAKPAVHHDAHHKAPAYDHGHAAHHAPAKAPAHHVAPAHHAAPAHHGGYHGAHGRSHYTHHEKPMAHAYHAGHDVVHHAYAVKAPHAKCGANLLVGCAPSVAKVPCLPVHEHYGHHVGHAYH